MNQEIHTLEIARLYESQGYYQDAYNEYLLLDKVNSTNQTQAGISRMKTKTVSLNKKNPEKKVGQLLEQWIKMVVLKHRLSRFNKIKSRLT